MCSQETKHPDTIKSTNKCQPVFVLISGFWCRGNERLKDSGERQPVWSHKHVLPALSGAKSVSTYLWNPTGNKEGSFVATGININFTDLHTHINTQTHMTT